MSSGIYTYLTTDMPDDRKGVILCTRLTFHPLLEFDDGKRKLDFKFYDKRLCVFDQHFSLSAVQQCRDELIGSTLHRGLVVDLVSVPCGKCIECLKSRSEAWATRIMCEVKSIGPHVGCFATLTYDDFHLPGNGSLDKPEIQKFLKRLRYFLSPLSLRFFLCGEYGPKTCRPHYHAIFLVKGLDDFRKLDSAIRKAWNFGFVDLDFGVDFACSAYVARYVDKKIESGVKDSDFEKVGLEPPFLLMSKGLGRDFAVASSDSLASLGYVQLKNGKSSPIPRYFEKVFEQSALDVLKAKKQRSSDFCVSRGISHAKALGVSLGVWLQNKESLMALHKRSLVRKDH